ncbi:MAG: isoleucine--tRNA ligase [Chloroflexi bacterium]|nr:isoleucine--tRNA ligase [Chloroflexota bacterium]
MFEPIQTALQLPELERKRLDWWRDHDILHKYLTKNSHSLKRFSFIDGPITANNPMGIHHAWGRTYKDLFQRYKTMQGFRQRYQNGFDCQGLWVEVEVERELGFKSKRDIEAFGIARFVELCKERVLRFSKRQTEQSIRLGYFMDWDHSYYTMSDENNYMIWTFLKRCHEHGWIYRGHDVMPWCVRCGTALSEHEIATEGYREIEHQSVFVRFPLVERPEEYLLVWTTTPWTLPGNVAAAVNPELTYVKVEQDGAFYFLSKRTISSALQGEFRVVEELPGSELVGLHYRGPFDELPVAAGLQHEVLPWADVGEEEGTGIVHIAPSSGREDLHLWREHHNETEMAANKAGVPIPAPIDELGFFVAGFGQLTGREVATVAPDIFAALAQKGMLYHIRPFIHRYPVCWRCGSELVFRLVDEWFINLDQARSRIMRVTEQIRWIPSFGLERELDWLRNMDDWMISKKRFWGLALPFFPCPNCGHLEVIGSREELEQKSIGPLPPMPSPHRPWIDAVRIRCPECGATVQRVPDVGNPWLDAGIVPFSTLDYRTRRDYWEEWFPADFITESFPGQYRNWFYSLLTMATVLEDRPPFLTVLGHGQVRDEHGREMHKSWGNSIEFDQAAERVGADAIRWLYLGANPASNVNLGWGIFEEVTRRLLTLWNSYGFFVTYANLDGFDPTHTTVPYRERPELDRWLLARQQELIRTVTQHLDDFDTPSAVQTLERFIDDLSNWYIRRGRRRYWKSSADSDKAAAYLTLYEVLVTLSQLLAPFMPFLAEEMYINLAGSLHTDAPPSVHLTDWPTVCEELLDHDLLDRMRAVRTVVELGRAARSKAGIKVRQTLPRVLVASPSVRGEGFEPLLDHIRDELNVKEVRLVEEEGEIHDFVVQPNLRVVGPKYGPRVRDITALLRAGKYRILPDGSVEAGEFHLSNDEVNRLARPRSSLAVTEGDGVVVALDTTITPDLELEGQARDLVRRVQMMRKEANLQLQDRIVLGWRGSESLAGLLEEWGDYIRQETLANQLVQDPQDMTLSWQGTVGTIEVELSLRKAS